MNDFITRNKIPIRVMSTMQEEEHFHQDIELLYILDGEMKLVIYEKMFILKSEDVIVINSNEKHSFTASADILFAKVTIVYSLIHQVYNGINTMFLCNSIEANDENYTELKGILRKLLLNQLLSEQEEIGNKISYEYLSDYFHLLEVLTVHFLMNISSVGTSTQKDKSQQRMIKINDYIQGNYSKVISLQDLSDYLYLSEGYLSRYFKQTFNMNFTEYLKQVRLSHALDELMYTDRAITKIAYDNGFSSVSFFNRVFKQEYGKTPSAMRKGNPKQEEKKNIEKNNQEINKKLELFLNETKPREIKMTATGEKAHYFSVLNSEEIVPNWNQIINIGAASDLLKNEIQEHVNFLKEKMGYKYLRFWSIFSKEMLIDVLSDTGDYNFTKLNQVLDFILSADLKPFIDLEEKVKRINANAKSTMLYEDNRIELKSDKQWEKVMEALIRHLVKRYGVEEVSQWKIEVWYGGYHIAGKDDLNSYFSIFQTTHRIAKKYIPEIEIGGCGMFPGFVQESEHNNLDFWTKWKDQNRQPDFISQMNYSYEVDLKDQKQFEKKSTDEQFLLHSIQKLKREISMAGFENCKIYITEWNLTISDRNYMNDTCFQGAYIIKNIIDIYKEVNMIGYFNGSDRTSEYYDSDRLLHGGQGLLSKDGISKPSAFAIEFLNKLYPHYIGKTNNFMITTNKRNSYGIICHNMKKLSYYYYLSTEDMIKREKVWKCFDNRNDLDLEICLEDVANGEYQIKVQRINEKNGSVFDLWKELNFHSDLSREDVKYFQRVCEPRLMIKHYVVENNKLSMRINMEANEIAFIKITKDM